MFKCPNCDEKYEQLPDLLNHIEEDHGDLIPKDQTVSQYYYMTKTGKTHGTCVVCKSKTNWNEKTNKYHRFCKNPTCKETYRETFKKRMIGVHGKVSLLNDPNHQKKMLANRSISGEYTWSDGKKLTYTGSYELDFLKFLDLFMGFDSEDIMSPSPHTYYYMYNGEKKFYMPDFFIPSLNLELEIKDGGDNENKHGKIQAIDKVKEKLKDQVLMSQKNFSYLKIINKQYNNFFDFLLETKKMIAEHGEMKQIFDLGDNKGPIIKSYVVESSIADYFDIDDEFIRSMVQTIDSSSVLKEVLEGFELPEDLLEELDEYANFLDADTDFLLYELEQFKRDYDYDISVHNVGKYLKDKDLINRDAKTPGFSSPYVSSIFVNILEHMVSDTINKEEIKHLCDEFENSLRGNADPEYLKVYQRDKKAMTYYFKLLSSKLDQKRLDICLLDSYLNDIVKEVTLQVEGKEAYPVYVLLTHTGTILSNTIKTVTRNPYSHASISFDANLNEMYSFGRKYKSNPLIGTFVKEDIRSGLYEDVMEHADYALYVTFVTKEQLQSMKERLNYFKQDGNSFKYSFIGLINYKLGKESDSVDKFFCSQFVDHILSAGRQYFDRHSSLVQPGDFASHRDFYFVSKGKLKNYDIDEVNKKVEKISKKAKFEKRKVSEDTIVYVGLTTEDIKNREKVYIGNPGKYVSVKSNLPELKKSIEQGELPSNITHYSVLSLSELKKRSMVLKTTNGYLIETPVSIKIKNINKLT